MAVSPSLSHFSQQKASRQRTLEGFRKVSDECSSGVVRWCMRPGPLPGACYLTHQSNIPTGINSYKYDADIEKQRSALQGESALRAIGHEYH